MDGYGGQAAYSVIAGVLGGASGLDAANGGTGPLAVALGADFAAGATDFSGANVQGFTDAATGLTLAQMVTAGCTDPGDGSGLNPLFGTTDADGNLLRSSDVPFFY